MSIPAKDNDVWKRLITGTVEIKFEFMALNLLIYNLKNKVSKQPDQMDAAIDEFRSFFEANQALPKVQSAISKLEEL